MKYRVRLTERAERDAESILRWFHEQSAPAAGERWYAQLIARIATLESHPERCAQAAEAEELGVRIHELRFGNRRFAYRILFRIRGRNVEILHLRHSARDALSADDL